MSDLELDIIETYNNNKDILPLNLIIEDLAQRYCMSKESMAYEFQKILGEESDGSLQFKDSYSKSRFLGK